MHAEQGEFMYSLLETGQRKRGETQAPQSLGTSDGLGQLGGGDKREGCSVVLTDLNGGQRALTLSYLFTINAFEANSCYQQFLLALAESV